MTDTHPRRGRQGSADLTRRRFLQAGAVGAGSLAFGGLISRASAAPAAFVARRGSDLVLMRRRWRLFGASIYGTSNPGGSGRIADMIGLSRRAGINTLRIVNFFDERGLDSAAPYAEADWRRVDALLAALRRAGMKAILDLSAYRNHLHNLELSTGGTDTPYSVAKTSEWSDFLTFVAGRTNTVNRLIYRDDPTIAIVSFAGEPNPPNSGEPLRPTTQELTDFYARVFGAWKQLDRNHLTSCGGLLHIDWEEVYGNPSGSGIDHGAIFALADHDVPSIHNYFPAFPPSRAIDHKTPKIAASCASLVKPWITEEFGFTQAPTDYSTVPPTVYTEANRGQWFRLVYDIQRTPHPPGVGIPVVPAAGVAFWNLGRELDPATHDVNPSTPATWSAVLRNAP
jgi:hypothetical protein